MIPVGWWHEVYALSPSISVGLTNLRGESYRAWYRPGDLGDEASALAGGAGGAAEGGALRG